MENKVQNTLRPVSPGGSNRPIWVYLAIGIFISLLYVNSLGNQFTNWDDGMIYQNSTIRHLNWEGIKRVFTYQPRNTYQPLRMLSYAIDYHFWKLNPMGYRITNILFYILTCIMVFFTLQLLSSHLRERASPDSHFRVALFGSLLFAAHPVHVEAVTWLAARKEVLHGFFFFSAFYLYLKGRDEEGRKRAIYLGVALLFVLLSVLSKPSAVVFPGIILVYEISRKKDSLFSFFKRHWIFFTIAGTISAIFTFILIRVMLDAGGVKPYYGKSLLENALVVLYVHLRSIKLLVFTVNYSAAYSFSVMLPVYHLKNILFALIALSLFVFSIWSLKRTKVIFFAFFFFLITMLPFLNIIPISTLLADRYVFIASFSYAFLLGVVFDRFYAYRHKNFSEGFFKLLSISLFFLLLTGYSYMTIRQNTIWENSYTLWADAVEKHPNSNTANALMGVVYMELGMDEEAQKYLEKAIQLLPYDYQSRNNLGIVYGKLNQPEKALKELAIAMELDPDNDNVKINLAILFLRQKEYEKSEKIYQYLINKNPKDSQLHFRLSFVYKEAGRYEKAISELEKASELTPHIINPYEEMGNIYASRLMNREKAIYYYSRGVEAAPRAKSRVEDLRWMVQDLQR